MKMVTSKRSLRRRVAAVAGAMVLCGGSAPALAAMSLTTLHAFSSAEGSPATLGPAVVVAADGNYYGALTGGSSGNGAIYRITPAGALTILHTFAGATDGSQPNGLALGTDGRLYGTTNAGGSKGLGTAFSIGTDGSFKTLHTFTGLLDGRFPTGPLTLGGDGNFYGTTLSGGLQDGSFILGGCPLTSFDGSAYKGCGTVYRMTTKGAVKVLHKFDFKNGDGWVPTGVMQASDGFLYGTTVQRSIDSGGVLFKLATDGSSYQILQDFGGSNGYGPSAPPTQGSDGNLYGTTVMGGIGAGNVYSLSLSGSFANVYSFAAGSNPATDPSTGLTQNPNNGLLYGGAGGGLFNGEIFSVSTAGAYTTEYSFTGGADGGQPYATLVPANPGSTSYIGTNNVGGAGGKGTLFRLDMQ